MSHWRELLYPTYRGKLIGLWVSAEKMGSQQQRTGTYKQRDLLWAEEPTMRAHWHTQAMQEGWRRQGPSVITVGETE